MLEFSSCTQKPTEVFLLIGQSNMAGRGEMLPIDTEPIPGVYLLNKHGMWETAHHPLNRHATDCKDLSLQGFNLGAPFAQAVREQNHDTVPGLIVNARGNTAIERWLPGADLYEHTLERVQKLDGIKLTAVLWHQGESNSHDEVYGEKLKHLIIELRDILDQPDLPFIAGHISIGNVINTQMDVIAADLPLVAIVSVKGLNCFDGTHYDRESLIELGRRYAKAYRGLITNDKRQNMHIE